MQLPKCSRKNASIPRKCSHSERSRGTCFCLCCCSCLLSVIPLQGNLLLRCFCLSGCHSRRKSAVSPPTTKAGAPSSPRLCLCGQVGDHDSSYQLPSAKTITYSMCRAQASSHERVIAFHVSLKYSPEAPRPMAMTSKAPHVNCCMIRLRFQSHRNIRTMSSRLPPS